jgi:hypothetical protein
MIFYFHVRHGDVIYLDRQGAECADLGAAWIHALLDARTLFRRREVTQRWIEIEDNLGAVIATPAEGATCR